MKWNQNSFDQKLVSQLRANAMRAAEFIADKARDKVSTPYPPASKPGEAPHRRTGNLERHINPKQGDAADIDEEVAAYVVEDGVSPKGFPYPAHHELNTGRPFLVPTLDENHDGVMAIMAQDDILNSQFGGVE